VIQVLPCNYSVNPITANKSHSCFKTKMIGV
jgi:hypothetical protein